MPSAKQSIKSKVVRSTDGSTNKNGNAPINAGQLYVNYVKKTYCCWLCTSNFGWYFYTR